MRWFRAARKDATFDTAGFFSSDGAKHARQSLEYDAAQQDKKSGARKPAAHPLRGSFFCSDSVKHSGIEYDAAQAEKSGALKPAAPTVATAQPSQWASIAPSRLPPVTNGAAPAQGSHSSLEVGQGEVIVHLQLSGSSALSDEAARCLMDALPLPTLAELHVDVLEPSQSPAAGAAAVAAQAARSNKSKSGSSTAGGDGGSGSSSRPERPQAALGAEGARAIVLAAAWAPACKRIKLSGLPTGAMQTAAVLEPLRDRDALGSLQVLQLVKCELAGPIPIFIGECTHLVELSMPRNALSGRIPFAIGRCTRLQALTLSHNRLSGPVPGALGSCRALQSLELDQNALSGAIPGALGRCTQLKKLHLNDNRLCGALPDEIGDCTSLQWLSAAKNELSGPIPSSLGACTALQSLSLFVNQLSGPIPRALGKCTALQSLGLHENALSEEVPFAELAGLTRLKRLGLHNNSGGLFVTPEGKAHLEKALVGAGTKCYWPAITTKWRNSFVLDPTAAFFSHLGKGGSTSPTAPPSTAHKERRGSVSGLLRGLRVSSSKAVPVEQQH